MTPVSLGDLARNFQSSRNISAAKSDLATLSQELASGRKQRLSPSQLQPLAAFERQMSQISAYQVVAAETLQLADAMQAALSAIGAQGEQFAPALLAAGSSANAVTIQSSSVDAARRFDAILSQLNTQLAGRHLFSGIDSDAPAVADAQTILADIGLAVAGLTDATTIEAAVEAWFDTTGGGFETLGFTGSGQPMRPIRVSGSETADLGVTAADPGIRQMLKGFAMAALVDRGVLAGNVAEQGKLLSRAGQRIIAAQQDLTGVQARIGVSQERITLAQTALKAEQSMLEQATAELTAADPYETATKFEAARGRLETIFTVTARLAALKFTDFMR